MAHWRTRTDVRLDDQRERKELIYYCSDYVPFEYMRQYPKPTTVYNNEVCYYTLPEVQLSDGSRIEQRGEISTVLDCSTIHGATPKAAWVVYIERPLPPTTVGTRRFSSETTIVTSK